MELTDCGLDGDFFGKTTFFATLSYLVNWSFTNGFKVAPFLDFPCLSFLSDFSHGHTVSFK